MPNLSASENVNGEKLYPEQMIASLRSILTTGEADLARSLQRIAEAARSLTGAGGAAIALPRDGRIICQTRDGELAPALGTKLDVDSGLSGECLRTGQVMRCNDTEKDLRVDTEVCRQLGLRSLAAAPLRGRHRAMGIIAVFSGLPYSFPDWHLEWLQQLAEVAVAVRAQFAECDKRTDETRRRVAV